MLFSELTVVAELGETDGGSKPAVAVTRGYITGRNVELWGGTVFAGTKRRERERERRDQPLSGVALPHQGGPSAIRGRALERSARAYGEVPGLSTIMPLLFHRQSKQWPIFDRLFKYKRPSLRVAEDRCTEFAKLSRRSNLFEL